MPGNAWALRLVVALALAAAVAGASAAKRFTVAADGSTLLRDGQPTRVLSGSFHYFRCPAAEWDSRMAMLAAAGLNSVQTYIAWNYHCPTNKTSECDFSGDRNLTLYFSLALKHGLQVMLRPGPFICAEWDLGGFPVWLQVAVGAGNLRSHDALYLQYVQKFFDLVLPTYVKPMLYENGGPIVMVQVENEYGMYGGDKQYIRKLRDIMRGLLGPNVLLYSTDPSNPSYVRNSAVEDVYQVVDFFSYGDPDTNVAQAFANQHVASKRNLSLPGPDFNDEFYPAWYTRWGASNFAYRSIDYLIPLTKKILVNASARSSLNYYMGFGGTNFGYWGALWIATSYDYNAPINESGHASPLFAPLSAVLYEMGAQTPRINGQIPTPPATLPQPPPLEAYGTQVMRWHASVWDAGVLALIAEAVAYSPAGAAVPTMEGIGQWQGYAMYSVVVRANVSKVVVKANDFAVVRADSDFIGYVWSGANNTIKLPAPRYVDTLWVLIEDMGHINNWINAPNSAFSKGLAAPVEVNGAPLVSSGYEIYGLPMSARSLSRVPWRALTAGSATGPGSFYRATFVLGSRAGGATLVDVSPYFWTGAGRFPFGKGIVVVNGHSLGRYWSTRGPQYVLYCPASYLHLDNATENELIVFEQVVGLQGRTAAVSFTTKNLNH